MSIPEHLTIRFKPVKGGLLIQVDSMRTEKGKEVWLEIGEIFPVEEACEKAVQVIDLFQRSLE